MNKHSFPIALSFRERMQADIEAQRTYPLAETLAAIDAAFPKPRGPADILAKLIARGDKVLIVENGRAVSFNDREGGR